MAQSGIARSSLFLSNVQDRFTRIGIFRLLGIDICCVELLLSDGLFRAKSRNL